MPGTRDVRELEPDSFGEQIRTLPDKEQSRRLHESMTQRIRNSLPYLRADKGKKPRAGFAVIGNGADALQGAFDVLVGNHSPRDSFDAGDEISLVFFSHQSGRYVHLDRIERQGETITVHYRRVPHSTNEITEHFALIPVGALPKGKYQIVIQSTPEKSEPNSAAKASLVVCGPFSFAVVNGDSND